jgi:hypothetical protein
VTTNACLGHCKVVNEVRTLLGEVFRGRWGGQELELARSWRLTPVILATHKAEIRRIEVRNQPMQIIPRDPISKIPNIKKGW